MTTLSSQDRRRGASGGGVAGEAGADRRNAAGRPRRDALREYLGPLVGHQLGATPGELRRYSHLNCDLHQLLGVLVRVMPAKDEIATFGDPDAELACGVAAVTPFIGGGGHQVLG